jgi:aspartyl protease family protein
MRSILAFAAMALVVGAVTPKLIEHVGERKSAASAVAMNADVQPPRDAPVTSSSRNVEIAPDRQGHFRVEARIDGRRLDFMVDTGASVIALTERDAARIGIRPRQSEYTATVKTANGTIKAAPAQLSSVEVDGIRVRDVRALVLPDNALSENLLGLSFLSRLRRFEYSRGKLVLER